MSIGTLDLHELEKLRKAQEEKIRAKTDQQKWRIILEPALAGAMIAINLGQTSLQNFYLRTACTVDLNKSLEVCDRGVGEEFRIAEAESQIIVSGVNVSRSFIGSLLSTIVLLFVGPWSDYSGRRKPLLILPLVGMSVMSTLVLLMITFPGASTVQVLYAVQIPMSLGGNFGLLLAAAFSYIGDICHSTGRDVTRTMGAHRAAIQISHVIGAVSGPLLYRHLGFYGVFPLVLLLQVASLLYVIIAVKDVNVNTENKMSVLNWRLPVDAVKCLFKKRDGHKRTVILLMLVVALGDRMFLSAEVLIAYMYYRYKFHWDDIMFGGFLAYRNIVSFCESGSQSHGAAYRLSYFGGRKWHSSLLTNLDVVFLYNRCRCPDLLLTFEDPAMPYFYHTLTKTGTLLILMVLKRRLRLSDEVVGAMSCMSYVLASSGLIAATTTLAVFMVPLVGIISQGSQVVQRPLLNKQILPNEQGKIYSVLGALESATQILSSPLYSLLYAKTVSTMSDAWLLPGIGLALLQLLAYLATRKLGARYIEENIPPRKNIRMHQLQKSETEKLRKEEECEEDKSESNSKLNLSEKSVKNDLDNK